MTSVNTTQDCSLDQQFINVGTALTTMLRFQHETNSHVEGSDYWIKPLDWNNAILVEVGELIDSTNYKWWKAPVDVDVDNIKTEIVDIWHFIMSKYITNYLRNIIRDAESEPNYTLVFTSLAAVSTKFFNEISNINVSIEDKNQYSLIIQAFSKTTLRACLDDSSSFEEVVLHFSKLVVASGMNFEEFTKRYLVKNALNKVRQDRGYKLGIYNKNWINHEGDYQEDNAVANYLILESKEGQSIEHSFSAIYDKLITYYDQMISSIITDTDEVQ